MSADKVLISIAVAEARGAARLPGTLTVARALADWGNAAGFETHLVSDEDEPLTVARLGAAINPVLSDQTRIIDHLLVHFAGHGFIRGFERLLLLSNWAVNGDEAIALSEFRERLCDYPLARLTLVIDACSEFDSARTARVKGSGVINQCAFARRRPVDVDVYDASSEGLPAFMLRGDTSQAPICLFSGALLRALSGAEDTTADAVRTHDLVSFVRQQVPSIAARYQLRVEPGAQGAFQAPNDLYATLPLAGFTPPSLPDPTAAIRQAVADLDTEAQVASSASGDWAQRASSLSKAISRGGIAIETSTAEGGAGRLATRAMDELRAAAGRFGDRRAASKRRRQIAEQLRRPPMRQATPVAAALAGLAHDAEPRLIAADLAIVGGLGQDDAMVLRHGPDLVGARLATGLVVPLYTLPGCTTMLYLNPTESVQGPLAIAWRTPDANADDAAATLDLLIRLADDRLVAAAEAGSALVGREIVATVARQPIAAVVRGYLADAVGDWRQVAALADGFEQVYGGLPFDLMLLSRRIHAGRGFGIAPVLAAGWRLLGEAQVQALPGLVGLGQQCVPSLPFVGLAGAAAEQFIVATEAEVRVDEDRLRPRHQQPVQQ